MPSGQAAADAARHHTLRVGVWSERAGRVRRTWGGGADRRERNRGGERQRGEYLSIATPPTPPDTETVTERRRGRGAEGQRGRGAEEQSDGGEGRQQSSRATERKGGRAIARQGGRAIELYRVLTRATERESETEEKQN